MRVVSEPSMITNQGEAAAQQCSNVMSCCILSSIKVNWHDPTHIQFWTKEKSYLGKRTVIIICWLVCWVGKQQSGQSSSFSFDYQKEPTSLIRKSCPACCNCHRPKIKFSFSKVNGMMSGPCICNSSTQPAALLSLDMPLLGRCYNIYLCIGTIALWGYKITFSW